MKALIRKHGCTPTTKEQNEVFLSSKWPCWINSDGWPLTEENYGYALCEDCPENIEDLDVDDFAVRSESYMVSDEFGEQHERTRWIAMFVGDGNTTPTDRMKEIEELKRKIAALESDM